MLKIQKVKLQTSQSASSASCSQQLISDSRTRRVLILFEFVEFNLEAFRGFRIVISSSDGLSGALLISGPGMDNWYYGCRRYKLASSIVRR